MNRSLHTKPSVNERLRTGRVVYDKSTNSCDRQRQIGLSEAWTRLWKNGDINGRASRSEFWGAQFWIFLINFVGLFFYAIFPLSASVFGIFAMVLSVLDFALTVRRLHDIGRSGWYFILTIIPLIGWLIIFVFASLPSEPRENKYGPIPNVK